jgi:cytoskeletal protein RodZ
MTEKSRPLSFGRYLRSVRREKGLDLERVSRETRIGIDTLNLIEQEDLPGLPSEVFVKGFLRAYAKAIGANGDRAVEGYRESLARLQKTEQSEMDLSRLSNRFWSRLFMALGILVVLIAGSILVLSIFDKDNTVPKAPPQSDSAAAKPVVAVPLESELPPKEQENVETTPLPEIESTQRSSGEVFAEEDTLKEPAPFSAPSSPGESLPAKQILQITAVEETWIKIVIDDEKTRQVTLKPGDQLALEALLGYELLVGNAAGIRMTLNGDTVKLDGKKGQVRSLKLP